MAKDYSHERPITAADKQKERDRAGRFHYRTKYALSVECSDEADQQRLFNGLAKLLKSRRIRVVVS